MKKIFYLVFLVVICSCNSRRQMEQEADSRLEKIQQLIESNSYAAAQKEIKRLHKDFPRLVSKRKIASSLRDTIIRRESSRLLDSCNKILPIRQQSLDSLMQRFRFEKQDAYQDLGNFVHVSQFTEANANRVYLKAYVDEKGKLFLISNFTGPKILHLRLSASVGSLSVVSDSISANDAAFNAYNDGVSYHESLRLQGKGCENIASFIAQNINQRIRITLLGKANYVYYIDKSDKNALAETYRFWKVFNEVDALRKNITNSAMKIVLINRRKAQ